VTVGDLIARLQRFAPTAEVDVMDRDGEDWGPFVVELDDCGVVIMRDPELRGDETGP
jgi:hypothetical protein